MGARGKIMKRVILRGVFVAVICLVGGVNRAWARAGEGFQIGNLKLSPFVQVSGTHDSNVYLTPDHESCTRLGTAPGV